MGNRLRLENVVTANKGRRSWANLFVIEGMYSILKQRTSLSVPIRAGHHIVNCWIPCDCFNSTVNDFGAVMNYNHMNILLHCNSIKLNKYFIFNSSAIYVVVKFLYRKLKNSKWSWVKRTNRSWKMK